MAAAVPIILKASAVFTTLTGALNVINGVGMLADGSVFPPKSQQSALADSQIRYLGAIMASAGLVAWWASNDIVEGRWCWRSLVPGTLLAVLAGLWQGPSMDLCRI
ncbi:hypothetical protein E2P81_ATG10497 [Venturia nashicola]|nr:hypothetical protein E2P81_ATG10497 [Venturia nashicola]